MNIWTWLIIWFVVSALLAPIIGMFCGQTDLDEEEHL
jgi:hypothetical protein